MTDAEIGRFRRIESVFDRALDQAGPDREAWLREACGADTELYDAVVSFLIDHETLTALRQPAREPMPRFGAWQAVSLLGRGGMGTVYLAERADGAFRMSAAVKVVPLALASPEIEERFRRERQFLAGFDHQGIARLIDGGLSEHGIPYLVMEFVDGLPIDRFCKDRQATDLECAALFRQLMEALIYIHGRQVVHRDLKPSNIFVDRTGRVKLLDFGTARLADAGAGDAITESGVFALTRNYASPEQLAGAAVTFASDIYSAGLVLREILPSGTPRKPLATILDKALRTHPKDRYRSAAEMDADLVRCLAGQRVSAGSVSRRYWALSVALVAAALILFVGRFRSSNEPPSLAVMPFANLSPDPANRYLSESFTGEITDALAHVKGLKVIARPSASEATAKTPNVREAGRALHVANVLEGSVQRSGDRIRVVARLERVSDGALLWSNTFERAATNLFAVQSELAADVAGNLRPGAGVSAARHVPDAEAHDLVMKARYEMQQVTPDSLTRAEAYFKQAIDRDPQYAEAYSGLASEAYNRSVANGSTGQTEADRRTAEQMARKALALDPGLAPARAMLATLAMQYDWDWTRAEREYQQAGSAFPSAAVEGQYAYLLLFRGRFAEADRHIRRLLDLDPFSTVTMFNVSLYRDVERRYPEAREISQRIAAQYPAMIPPQQVIGHTWLAEGRPDLALKILQPLEPRFPQIRVYEAQAYVAAGRREEALRLILPFERKYPDPGVPLHWFAAAYASMGDEANALKWLERSADRHEWQILSLNVNPVFDKMRNSPEFLAIRKRIGLSE